MNVVDSISTSSPAAIESALGLLTKALQSKTDNLAIEAAFAMFEIARRPDGGSLLRGRISDLASLLTSKDERLSGGAALTFGYLHQTVPEMTTPILIRHLSGGESSIVKTQIARTLLQSKSVDETAWKVIEAYVKQPATGEVKVANLYAVANSASRSQVFVPFVVQSLNDDNKYVKVAAIYAVNSLGPEARIVALSSVNKLAADPNEDRQVRRVADLFLRGRLGDPSFKPDIPERPQRPQPRN
ncbi:MAG: hypothetical protein SFV18_05800 [Bryobacteraceae bacterium]|nr:hypothetical protein [Bryobacteraceae bacterium]